MAIQAIAFRSLAVMAMVLVASCHPASVLKQDAASADKEVGEGFVLVGADRKWVGVKKNDSPSLEVRWTRMGAPMLYRESVFFQFTDVTLEKLPAGDYYLHNSSFGGKRMHLPDLKFRIVPGQVTYVGDFNITVKPRLLADFVIKRTLEVVDNINPTVAKFKEKYPEIANAHTVRAEVTPVSLRDEF